MEKKLAGKTALVTGGSRGAGRGIALALGAEGATVYVTGRSSRGHSTDPVGGSVDETAEEVTARGGRGIAVRCDHSAEREVQALFVRIGREQRRLDLLVNNAWGGYAGNHPALRLFWEQPVPWAEAFEAGLRAHLIATRLAVPLMLREPVAARRFAGMCQTCGQAAFAGEKTLPGERGLVRHADDCRGALARVRAHALIVSTVAWLGGPYLGTVYYDVAKGSIVRMAFALAQELRRYGIASIALAPGSMRTERVLAAHERQPLDLSPTESPEYVGRAVAALATDLDLMR